MVLDEFETTSLAQDDARKVKWQFAGRGTQHQLARTTFARACIRERRALRRGEHEVALHAGRDVLACDGNAVHRAAVDASLLQAVKDGGGRKTCVVLDTRKGFLGHVRHHRASNQQAGGRIVSKCDP